MKRKTAVVGKHGGRASSRGVSLIELMIAMAIGTVLLIALVQVFAASRTAYQLSTGLARVQENGRFAMDFLQRDLRMGGHVGCVNDQARFLPENVTPSRPALALTFLTAAQQQAGNYGALTGDKAPLRFDVGIQGYEARIDGTGGTTGSGAQVTLASDPALAGAGSAWLPAVPTELFNAMNGGTSGKPVQNSDIVVLRYFNAVGAPMVAFTPGNPSTLSFTNGKNLLDGATDPGLFGISDCVNAAVFEATTATIPNDTTTQGQLKVNVSGLNASGLLGNQSYVEGQATIYRAESLVYYVGRNASGNPALYRIRFTAKPGEAGLTAQREEMVEGIESLQFQYAQDSRVAVTARPTGNMGTSELASAVKPTADPVTAWRRVGMVQVGLVARSPDTAAAQQRDTSNAAVTPLSALGVRITPPAVNDGRYRAVYEDSIVMRNRMFGN